MLSISMPCLIKRSEGIPMTNEKILAIAMAQSAIDCNCSADDFTKEEMMTILKTLC